MPAAKKPAAKKEPVEAVAPEAPQDPFAPSIDELLAQLEKQGVGVHVQLAVTTIRSAKMERAIQTGQLIVNPDLAKKE